MPTQPIPRLVSEYLLASGVSAIAVVKTKTGYQIAMGRYATQDEVTAAVSKVYWLEGKCAAKTARLARKNITEDMDQATVDRELHAAAIKVGARLTDDNIVMARATFAAQRLKVYLDNMNAVGGMEQFNKEYALLRKRATARGEKFMSFNVARSRLRRVLIQLLIDKKELDVPARFFDEVFKTNLKPNERKSNDRHDPL